MSSSAKCWIAGKIVDRSDANIPLSDLGLSRGYAAFDALRTYGRVPFLLDEHLERLEVSCALLFLKPPMERKALSDIVHQTLAANRFPESLIRIFVTAGDAAGFIPDGKERLMVLVDPLRSSPPQQCTVGVGLATTGLGRTLPLAKSTCYIAGIRETIRARNEGFDEVVFCDEDGSILEGTTFNCFLRMRTRRRRAIVTSLSRSSTPSRFIKSRRSSKSTSCARARIACS